MSAAIEISPALLRTRLVQAGAQPSDYEIQMAAGLVATRSAHKTAAALGGALPGFGRYGFQWRNFNENRRALAHAGRRVRGGDGRLPNRIREAYPEGQRAALSVIAEEVAKRGRCELMIHQIANRARVSTRTVQYALARAKHADVGHITVTEVKRGRGYRNRPNVIRIRDANWLFWIKPRAAKASGKGCKEVHTHESNRLNQGSESGASTVSASREPSAKAEKGLLRGNVPKNRCRQPRATP
tara:strand:- start:14447 stop:15172 length:726 start_codon:yes stop_codon:yes gene_type:complete